MFVSPWPKQVSLMLCLGEGVGESESLGRKAIPSEGVLPNNQSRGG